MKKKPIRGIAIAAIVLVFLAAAVAQLKIEPADGGTGVSAGGGQGLAASEIGETAPDTALEAAPDGDTASDTGAGAEHGPAGDSETRAAGGGDSGPPQNAEPAQAESAEPPDSGPSAQSCTVEIRCDTVADTSKLENQSVAPYIPENGVILPATRVEFAEGESVFDVLKRVTREKDVQMEFREDSLYSGAYIEGINYLYEFDAGSLSGWMYQVNGQFPNYGCSQYSLEDGDAVVWLYTCDLGRDVGDNSTW